MKLVSWTELGGEETKSFAGTARSRTTRAVVSPAESREAQDVAPKEEVADAGIAISDELKMIGQPLEYIPAEPFAEFLARLKTIIREKEVELIVVGMPRSMDGSYGPAALKVQEFVAVLKDALITPIQTWDERLTSAQANRFLGSSSDSTVVIPDFFARVSQRVNAHVDISAPVFGGIAFFAARENASRFVFDAAAG